MIGGFSVKFIGTLMELFIPMLLAYMIDDVVPTGNKGAIYLWGGFMLLCSVIALLGNITANRMAARVARNTTETLRSQLFSRISYLSSRQVDAFTIPSLESRLTSDTYNVHHMIGMLQRLGVRHEQRKVNCHCGTGRVSVLCGSAKILHTTSSIRSLRKYFSSSGVPWENLLYWYCVK